jgi:nitroreductase/predicted enzyme related to lactoylglutathione lyase
MITGLAHTAICVPDVEAAVAWYRDVLGLRVLSPPYRMDGDAIERDMGELVPSPVVLKAAILGIDGSDRVLEVIEYPNAPGLARERDLIDPGITHIGLTCDDIDATRTRLETAGVTFLTTGIADVAGVRTTWFVDPWGVVFILVEKKHATRPYWRQYDTDDLPLDTVGLLEGLSTTRAIRRYRDEPVPEEALRAMLFAATRAPSGSNRQPFRFIVLTDGPKAREAKRLIGEAGRRIWTNKRERDQYDRGSGVEEDSPKSRMARTMQQYVDEFEKVPVLILPCLVRYRDPTPTEGASVYPACQNLLLAARALGYGGAFNGFNQMVDAELRDLLGVPDGTAIAGTITLGKPAGHHGPVRRRPIAELVYDDEWGSAPAWAVDPPGTEFTSAGPPSA